MSTNVETLLRNALELSETERWEIVSGLLESMPPDVGLSEDDPGFFDELERRCNDGSPGIPWEEVEAMLEKRYPADG